MVISSLAISPLVILSLAVLLALAALIKPLQNSFYILHIFLVIILSWLFDAHIEKINNFSINSIYIFLFLHLLSINFVTFLAYYYDKYAAKKHKWRISEKTLFALTVLGGTPSAIIARKILRHKTKKKTFKKRFCLIILLQIIAIIILFVI